MVCVALLIPKPEHSTDASFSLAWYLQSISVEGKALVDISTWKETLWFDLVWLYRQIKQGKLASRLWSSPQWARKLWRALVVAKGYCTCGCGVPEGQPTLIFHSQEPGLLHKENTACQYSSTSNFFTAKYQKARRTGKVQQRKGTSSIKVHGNGEQVQVAEFLLLPRLECPGAWQEGGGDNRPRSDQLYP